MTTLASDGLNRPVRSTDTFAAHQAADAVVNSGKRKTQAQLVAEKIREHPGSTSAELAKICGLNRYMVARRLPSAEQQGLVWRGADTTCSVSGFAGTTTWWPTLPEAK
jgi:hypothetical protein